MSKKTSQFTRLGVLKSPDAYKKIKSLMENVWKFVDGMELSVAELALMESLAIKLLIEEFKDLREICVSALMRQLRDKNDGVKQ